ncbi:hypothetical protein CMUS01_16446 [Colletotrichum musicola]|uniref:Uncharacterized protein n=1 Tax=Colletotrichum musicola TaxID=2175873 RepID=A0A8H6MJ09_9PEZI|nr:hypothetical protein CMUS01_16446 [Colletotrichum musicola]
MSAPAISRNPGDAGLTMGLASTSFVAWLLVGALAYGDDSLAVLEALPLLTGSLSTVSVVCLIFAANELQVAGKRQGGAYYTAAVVGFGISASYSLVSSGWASGHRRVFWALGGIFGGVLFEAATRFCASCAHRLQASFSRMRPGSDAGTPRSVEMSR